MKLAIIGSGNIGGAIALGLSKSNIISASDIICADKSDAVLAKIRASNPEIVTSTDNVISVKNADVVIIAVKPWLVETVIDEIKPVTDYSRQMFVSVAAGINTFKLSRFLDKDDSEPTFFRIIPNTAVEVRESVNFIAPYNATDEQTNIIVKLFATLGLTFVINENLMGAATSLASCGIAYAFRYIRACMEGAVELGFYPAQAQEIVMQTLKGAVALLDARKSHPESEIDCVTTPGGITIKGLNAMEENGFTNAVIKGLKASNV
ncbi:MAG: pyrroline-5-carboxylate reductase [Tannerella sp.]|jgi:pyrroline-5-carboxylate reductase|nr:pyrroline-5-carboxylate reductase [Tannerella sp.]